MTSFFNGVRIMTSSLAVLLLSAVNAFATQRPIAADV